MNNENITWTSTTPQSGNYVVRPDYRSKCDIGTPIPYTLRVNKNGAVTTYQGVFQAGESNGDDDTDGSHTITVPVP